MKSVVVGAALVVALLGCTAPDDGPTDSSQTPADDASTRSLSSLADLPTGRPPRLSYVVSGTSVVLEGGPVDLSWEVEAIEGDLVYDADDGMIHRLGPAGTRLVSRDATSAPVLGGNVAWIERGNEIVQQQYRGRAHQPLPDGCCDGARVVGYDFDIDVDLFVTAAEGSWMWDTYEGGEGRADTPPDSEDFFWPVGGLGAGELVGTGAGSEVLIDYPGHEWGWGYVDGPRDPSRDGPVRYDEQERLSARQVWLTSRAIVAREVTGRLVVLSAEHRYRDSRGWRTLTGRRTAFALPDGLEVQGVVDERSSDSMRRRWTVLVDATDRDGDRAWVRCSLRTYACEIAAELGPDDVVPP